MFAPFAGLRATREIAWRKNVLRLALTVARSSALAAPHGGAGLGRARRQAGRLPLVGRTRFVGRAMSAKLKSLSADAGRRSGNEGVVARLRHPTACDSSKESFPSFENYGCWPPTYRKSVTSPAGCRTDARGTRHGRLKLKLSRERQYHLSSGFHGPPLLPHARLASRLAPRPAAGRVPSCLFNSR